MGSTAFLGLETTTQAAGSAISFLEWRLSMNNNTSSNMTKIDTFASEASASITALTSGIFYIVNATEDTANNYVATVSGISAYSTDLVISLNVDVTITDTATLNINSYGVKSLYKVQSNGVAGNLEAGDLVAGRHYLFQYNALGYWVWINGTNADQVNIAGAEGDLPIITASGITSSGSSFSDFAPSTASFVIYGTGNTGIDNAVSAVAGSKITISKSGSEIITAFNVGELSINEISSASFIIYGSGSDLTNGTSIVAGSSTNISKSGSQVFINVNALSPIISGASSLSHANSGVSATTYTFPTFSVNETGHVTSASVSALVATTSVVNSGISASSLVSASSLSGSNYGKKTCFIPLNQATALEGGETQYVRIPSMMNGWKLVEVFASCSGSSTSGSPVFTVYSGSQTMLSTNITIDQGEYDSLTATTQPVINSTYRTVSTGNKIWATSLVGSSGSGVTYSGVGLTFQNIA